MTPFPRDLVALVPDNDYQEALRGLLTKRTLSLRIRPITFTIHKHARHDPGCFNTAPELLAGFLREAHHALVVFDHEGSGAEAMACADAAHHLRERLARRGWGDRAAVVVVQPEIEVWVWGPSPHVERVVGWTDRPQSLREWLNGAGRWAHELPKPPRPKECLRLALSETGVPPSSAIFRQLAENVSVEGCTDQAFGQLVSILRGWFPPA